MDHVLPPENSEVSNAGSEVLTQHAKELREALKENQIEAARIKRELKETEQQIQAAENS